MRDHGAGVADTGPGSGSRGDVDTSIIGVGTGGSSVSISGPGDPPGPDDTTEGGGSPFAAPAPPRRQADAVIEPRKAATKLERKPLRGTPGSGGASSSRQTRVRFARGKVPPPSLIRKRAMTTPSPER